MLKVLVVDSSIFSQKVIASALNKVRQDVEITFAINGEEGFSKYQELNPDFVILDILMPKLNGQELIYLIKKIDENAKIFVVSADIQRSVLKEINKDIMAFIYKPFTDQKAQLMYMLMKEHLNKEVAVLS